MVVYILRIIVIITGSYPVACVLQKLFDDDLKVGDLIVASVSVDDVEEK